MSFQVNAITHVAFTYMGDLDALVNYRARHQPRVLVPSLEEYGVGVSCWTLRVLTFLKNSNPQFVPETKCNGSLHMCGLKLCTLPFYTRQMVY